MRKCFIALLLAVFLTAQSFASNEPDQTVVYLTFDDGPSGAVTQQLLDRLREAQVQATFFLCGYRVAQYPELCARIAAEGHAIGVHGYSHRHLTTLPPEQIRWELERTFSLITEVTGVPPKYYRPPGGLRNETVERVAEQVGLELMLWTVDPEDWRVRRQKEIAASVLAQAGGGDVILLHDLSLESVAATEQIIRRLRERGCQFAVLP